MSAETELEPGAAAAAEQPRAQSLQERLREKRQQVADRKTVDLELPGYGGELVARYRLLNLTGPASIDAIHRKVAGQPFETESERGIAGAIDILIAACTGIYARDLETGELTALGGDTPMRYDHALAEWLDFPVSEVSPGRSIVRGVFVDNENAITDHLAVLLAWMNDTSRKVDERFFRGGP